MTGALTRMTEDIMLALSCLGRPVVTVLLGCFVAIESFLSRQSWLTLCRETGFLVAGAFGVVTVFLRRDSGAACGLVLCRDNSASGRN